MAHVTKVRRLANPRRKRMSPAQIMSFGTRRQKASLFRRHPSLRKTKAGRRWEAYSRSTHTRRRTHGVRNRRSAAGFTRRRNQTDFGLGGSGGLITRAEQAAQSAIRGVERAAQDAIHTVTSRLNTSRRKTTKSLRRAGIYGIGAPRPRPRLKPRSMNAKRYWIGGAIKKPGALHRQLGIPQGQKIPLSTLRSAAKAPGKLGQRARMALRLRGFHHNKRRNKGQRKRAGMMHRAYPRGLRPYMAKARSWRYKYTHRPRRRPGRGKRAPGGRYPNVGEILTIVPANPGRRRRSMAYRTHNRRHRNRRRHNWRDLRGHNRYRNRRRHNARRRHHNYRHRNPRVRYVNRYRHYRHNRARHRNPGFTTGTTGTVLGILSGAAVTKVITGFLPANLTTGWPGMITTAVAAVVVGKGAGKLMRNNQFGNWMMIGGLLIVALEAVNQFLPALQLPFGLTSGTSGMGLISSSNFYVPQVNMPGSMASFVTPAGVSAAIPVVPASGMSGIGGPQFGPGLRTMRRIGRMR